MRKRLIMLLPYYAPDVAADGQLFGLLARELASRGVHVKVLTWKPRYQGMRTAAPARETRDGVTIRRFWAPRTGKSLPARAFAAWWITATAFFRAIFTRGTLLMPSSPPTLGLVGWALSRFGRRYVYVLHDLHPDLGIALGRMKPGLTASILRFIQRHVLARGSTAALTDGMAENARKTQPRARVTVIPNWVDTQSITPRSKAESAFARDNGLVEPFVIQYSGNLGLLHPLEGLTLAMKELPDCVLTYIGRGARLEATRKLAHGMANVRFFDYQPLEALPDSLAACDIAAVAIEPGADRLAMPSKLQGILAAGRPVLALAPAESELAQLVKQHDCGWVVAEFNDPQAVGRAIAAIQADPQNAERQAANARALAEEAFGVAQAAYAYEALL